MNTLQLLDLFDSLPDLLAMARERVINLGDDLYAIQDTLAEEHRRQGISFKWSMPYRHLDYCPICGCGSTAIEYRLENPGVTDETSPLRRVVLWEGDVHAVREHGGQFSEACEDFLSNMAAG